MSIDYPDTSRMSLTPPLLVSGRNDDELRAHASQWANWLEEHPDASWTAVLRTAAVRPHLRHRAAVDADSVAEAIDALRTLSAGLVHPAVTQDRAQSRSGLAFVFSGHGGQWPAMGQGLLGEVPAFTEAAGACDVALTSHAGWSVRSALLGDRGDEHEHTDLNRFDIGLSANFAMGIGLAAAYRDLGIFPDAVVGHSLGEMTAAVVAGALTVHEGACGVSTAGRLATEFPRAGGMLFVGLPLEQAQARVEPFEELHVGIVDSPDSTVLSGDVAAIEILEQQLEAEGIAYRRVNISSAPHSPHMDEPALGLRDAMATAVPQKTTVPMISSITGQPIAGTELGGEHWRRVLRSQVRFDEAMRRLLAEGIDTFLEFGPHPLLSIPIRATCLAEGAPDALVFSTMRRKQGGIGSFRRTLGALHCCGHHVPWRSLVDARGEQLPLPAYSLAPLGLDGDASEPKSPSVEPGQLESIVREELATVLEIGEQGTLTDDAELLALGLDSLKTIDLRNRISKRLGLRLPQHFLYDHPTIAQTTAALAERLAPTPAEPTPTPAKAVAKPKLPAVLAREPSLEARIDRILEPLSVQVCSALGREQLDFDASMREAGLDDVLGAELCLRIQREIGLRVFPRETVEHDSLNKLARHVAEAYGPYRAPESVTSLEQLDSQIASPYHSWPVEDRESGREPTSDQELVFILSPPRSGSTLLRVMLAGHSALFSPQELYLAPFETMAGYDACLNGTVLNMGLVGAIAEVISRTGSWNLYRQWVREAKPTAEVYEFFRSRIGARTLVDKSPLFFPPLEVLRRLARQYPKARFVHLIRHPVSCIGSYVKERFEGIFEQTAGIDSYDAAEWCWTRVHEGIGEFAREISSDRLTQVYFEELAVDPERVMRRLCPALGVAFEPAVLEPYSGHRMVAGGFQVGDPNFVRHNRIMADKSEAWRKIALPRPLQGPTLDVAGRLGYDTEALRPDDTARSSDPSTKDSADAAMGGIGMENDIHLPADVVPAAAHVPSSEKPRAVLLTGGTGFLGAFLLDELLGQTDAKIYCLVRAEDPNHALVRLRENLSNYDLWKDEYEARIVTVPGDLGQPDMGLSDEARADLAHSIDAIYHCAARVSWLLPYSHLRDVNVGGLIQILRLACLDKTLPVHYVSSLGTAFMRPFEYRDMVEWMTQGSGLGTESILELPLGYIESKWVNMHIVKEARARGIPVGLYAPGLIGGHSASGVDSLSESQFLHALIKGSTQLGAFPDAHGWRFIPVDTAANRIIRASLTPQSHNLDLYLDSTSLIDPTQMVEVLSSHGYDVEEVPFAVWRQKVLELADAHNTSNALFGFTDVIYAFTPLRFRGQRMQMNWFLRNSEAPQGVRELLGDTEYVDQGLLDRLVGYYVRADAMPPRPEA